MKDSKEEYVQQLRVAADTSNAEIQTALQKLFNSSYQKNQNPQGQPDQFIQSVNEDSGPRGIDSQSFKAFNYGSNISLKIKVEQFIQEFFASFLSKLESICRNN